MSYCVIPGCLKPQNPEHHQNCQSCGAKLRLKDRYRALQPLGQGGFGRTFLAIDEDIPSKPACVIKQLCLHTPNARLYHKAVQLFRQEAVRLDDLGKHPQIPTLLAHFEQNHLLYLVQELIAGQTLEQEAETQGYYTEYQIWELLNDLLPTLKYIHDRQVVHRDIKPANIIRRAADRKLVLIDFGIAKLLSTTTTIPTGTVIGSPEYMAPEQNRGKVFPASDLYSVGVTCIRLLTQRSPFDLFSLEQDRWIWRDYLPSSTQINPRLGHILDQLIQQPLTKRYQSADAVLHDLTRPITARQRLGLPAGATRRREAPTQPPEEAAPKVSVNDEKLQAYLAAAKWQQADTETWNLIRMLLRKPADRDIFSGELAQLPCDELKAIDQLWQKYSRRRFSFSIQVRIYQTVGQDYGRFCDRVGWQRDNRSDRPALWRFESSAPVGHLPSRLPITGQQWYRHIAVLTAKFEECGK